MKVVLISGNSERQGFPPLGILYLASYVREYVEGLQIKIFDFIPSIEEVLDENPDVVGIGGLSIHYPNMYKFCQSLRAKFNGLLVMGGIHISTEKRLPAFVDIGVIGEGEITFKEILEAYKQNNYLDKERIKSIKGILFWDNDNLIETKAREKIGDLDSIPFPARDIVDMEYYLRPNNLFGSKVGKGATIISSRGCAYHCDFCPSSNYWGKPRYHSAKYVADEIESLVKNYNIEYLYICDDNFCSNLPRLRELADEIEKRKIELQIGAMGRVDFFNDEISDLYHRIGIVSLSFGLETGSQRLLHKLKHGNKMKIEEIKNTVENIHSKGFEVSACFMIGTPTETEEEILETLEFIKSLPLVKFHFSIATPFIGTDWWDIAVKEGIVPEEPGWEFWSTYNLKELSEGRPIFMSDMSIERLREIYKLFSKAQRDLFYFDWKSSLEQEDKN